MKKNEFFGRLVRAFIENEGITNAEFADKAGTTREYLQHILAGRCPSAHIVKSIAKSARASSRQLLSAAGYKSEAGLLLIRGIPGSGKTTMAKAIMESILPGACNFEADMFWIQEDGSYKFDINRLKEAHSWCWHQTLAALMNDKKVIVSNTFIKHWEMKRYSMMAQALKIPFSVIEAHGEFDSIHPVPKEVIERMKNDFEGLNHELLQGEEEELERLFYLEGVRFFKFEGEKYLYLKANESLEDSASLSNAPAVVCIDF